MPTFQAVRPWSRSLTVSQGKGLTPMAAAVSALLEAVELAAAERPITPCATGPLRSLGSEASTLWRGGDNPLRISLDPNRERGWVNGHDLLSGRAASVPQDLLLLDFARPSSPDAPPSSMGLAIGNTTAESLVGGVAEVVEHDLAARFDRLSPRQRRSSEVELGGVDDRVMRALLDGMARRGFSVLAWNMGQEVGIAAFRCVLFQQRGRRSAIAPAGGSGCHPDRRIAFLRALLEAAQSRATMVAGARDDLRPHAYRDGPDRQLRVVVENLCFGPGPLGWRDVPDQRSRSARGDLDLLLATAARLSPSPVIAVAHPQPHPSLYLNHVIAPGLLKPGRDRRKGADVRRAEAPVVIGLRSRARPVVFAGPSLPPGFRAPGVEVRPPAICGDLARLLDWPPSAVGLVDGCFEIAPTVWHKEILDLLARGVPVLGAASLGAIRAAELATFGMRGVGAIFVAYAAGAIRRDDAVMLDHAPAELGCSPLTLALVDAEAALLTTPMPAGERRMLLRIARTLTYKERTWPLCLRIFAERTGRGACVDEATLAAAPSLKQRDALALVEALRGAERPNGPAPQRPPLTGGYLRLLSTSRDPTPPLLRPAPS